MCYMQDQSKCISSPKLWSPATAHKWSEIATHLGFDLGQIDSIRKDYPFEDRDRVTAVLRQWFDNAKNLPNACMYPKSWPGLIKLLEDAELSKVANELRTALLSPYNSVIML